MPSLVLEATWAAAGGTVIIYLAALVSVPPELYDAAEVDGAGILAKVWHVTLPHLRGIMLITLILQIIGTSQVFLEPYLFTDGGPDNAWRRGAATPRRLQPGVSVPCAELSRVGSGICR